MRYPIKSIDGNKVVNINGIESYIYEIIPTDIDQLTDNEIKEFYHNLKIYLNVLPTDISYKLYFLSDKVYLNTQDINPQIPNCKVISSDKNLELIFSDNEIWGTIQVFDDYLKANTTYFRFINILSPPTEISPLEFINLGDFFLNYKRYDNAKAKRKLSFKRGMHLSGLYKEMRDFDSENAYSQSEELLEKITLSEESLFKCEGWFVLKSENLIELNKKTKDLINYLKNIELKYYVETVGLSYFFKSFLFGVEPTFKRSFMCTSEYLSYMLPLTNDYLMDTGIILKSRSGNDIKLKIFNQVALNYNVIVTGASGQGKSFFVNKLVYEFLKDGTKSLIIDFGNSFRKLAEYNDANIFSYSFNPFQFKNPSYLKEFILSVVDKSEFNLKEQGRLLSEIKNALCENDVRTFKQLINTLNKSFEGINYYFEEFWEFFNDDLQKIKDLTYIDITLYPKQIHAPLIIYLTEYFDNIKGEKVFVVDEFWYVIEQIGSYVEKLFRTGRKERISSLVISQYLEDFLKSDLGRSIYKNCFYRFAFKEELKKIDDLDDFDKEKIKGLQSKKGEYSECYFKSETDRKVIVYQPCELEYELFTSDALDNQRIESFVKDFKKFFSFRECIEKWTRYKYA